MTLFLITTVVFTILSLFGGPPVMTALVYISIVGYRTESNHKKLIEKIESLEKEKTDET